MFLALGFACFILGFAIAIVLSKNRSGRIQDDVNQLFQLKGWSKSLEEKTKLSFTDEKLSNVKVLLTR